MKKIFLPLAATLLFTQAQAGFQNEIENVYVKAANTLLFFTSENIISSGSYELGIECPYGSLDFCIDDGIMLLQ